MCRGSVAEVGAAACGEGAGRRDEALTHGHVHALTERVAWEVKEHRMNHVIDRVAGASYIPSVIQ